jgi:hypothetical protein
MNSPKSAGEHMFDFSAETHAERLPAEGWHGAVIRSPRVSETADATWLSLPLELDTGHRVDDLICIDADAGRRFASRVSDGRRHVFKYLKAGSCPIKFNQLSDMEAALDGVEVEVQIRWRNPDFPVPAVRDVREPMKQPQKP